MLVTLAEVSGLIYWPRQSDKPHRILAVLSPSCTQTPINSSRALTTHVCHAASGCEIVPFIKPASTSERMSREHIVL